MNARKILQFASVAVLAASSSLSAQQWGRSAFPRDGVCFFKDPDFRGEYFCARAGDSIGSLGKDMNDEISSMRLFGDAEVTVFQDVRFSGRSSRFDREVRDMKRSGWDDRISSFRVRSVRGNEHAGGPSMTPAKAQEIVRRAYQSVLKREPDSGSAGFVEKVLREGWMQPDVERELRKSDEYRNKRR
jgi:hypothetical protein